MTSDANYELPDLDLSPFERALSQFQIAIDALAATPEDALIRDAVIQRFEFTYELSIKMLRRYLRFVAISDDEVNDFTFRDLIRRASDLKLIQGDVAAWIAFRQARADTVHTYNESRAIKVAAATTKFATEAHALLSALRANPAMIDILQPGLSEEDLPIVRKILDTHVPDRPVYVFGSRVTGKARRRSDIDLAIGGTEPLTLYQRGLLNMDFEESDLPVFVDVLDLNSIEADFRRRIARDFISIQAGLGAMERVLV